MADIAADGVPPFSPTGARQKHLGEHTTSIHDSGVRAGARMRPRRRPASELLRLIEVLVLNEVVEEGGTGQRTGGEKRCCAERACAKRVRAEYPGTRCRPTRLSLSPLPASAQVCSCVIWWYFTEPQELALPCLASVREVTLDLRFYMFWMF